MYPPRAALPDEAKESLMGLGSVERRDNARIGNRSRILLALAAGVLLSSLCWGTLFIVKDRHQHHTHIHAPVPSPKQSYGCGTTATEARALGCKFSLSAFGWVREPCFDAAIEQEYLDAVAWGFWMDQAGQHEVNSTIAGAGDDVIWTTWGQHYWHCWFVLKKVVSGVAVDGSQVLLSSADIGPGTHAGHCVNAMLEKEKHPWDLIMDRMEPNFFSCYM
ncbi:hypothetical protein DL98DRAFT_518486 [Cadophora sp. DSE1049]|nr:hypothetical protein DL98DRAFT_518486 [Cadophora sp. DSE1049]